MKTGYLVKNRKNHNIFTYNNKNYDYASIYQLIKELDYIKTGEDCDWQIIKVHDIESDKDCYCVAFKQSSTKEDWKHNLTFFPCPTKAYKGWKHKLIYHKGFLDEYQSARNTIKQTLTPLLQDLTKEQNCSFEDLKLFVIGWSLGASIAPIALEDFYETYGIKPILIGYEGANSCESKWTRKYVLSCMHKDSIIFVYSNDFVCRVPFFLGKKLKPVIYYLNDHKCKFPFYFIKKIISFIKDTEYYHTHTDEGILMYMPTDFNSYHHFF